MLATTNATSVARYINNITGELRTQGYTSEITRFEQAEKYGPWTLHLTVYSRRDKNTACEFELAIDPADGEGLSAEIPRLDVDFVDKTIPHRHDRRAEVREQLYMSLSDSESGDDFYNYGYNFLLVADALALAVNGASTDLADLAA